MRFVELDKMTEDYNYVKNVDNSPQSIHILIIRLAKYTFAASVVLYMVQVSSEYIKNRSIAGW